MRIIHSSRFNIIGVKLYRLYIFNINIYNYQHSKYIKWFKLFGKGLKFTHINIELCQSQRIRCSKYIIVGKWIITYIS